MWLTKIKNKNLDLASKIHAKFDFQLEGETLYRIKHLVNGVVPANLFIKFELAPKLKALAENDKFVQKNAKFYEMFAEFIRPFRGYSDDFEYATNIKQFLAHPVVNGIDQIAKTKTILLKILHTVEKAKYFMAKFVHTEREAIRVQVKKVK